MTNKNIRFKEREKTGIRWGLNIGTESGMDFRSGGGGY
jgi:hypothetical protein